MSNSIQVENSKRTGKLTIKHKIALAAFANLLIWAGNKILKLKTYEEVDKFGETMDKKMDALEELHKDDLEEVGKLLSE